MSKILDNLYLGSYQDARNQNFLNRSGITHIVTVGAELKTLYPKNFKYLYINALDTPSYRLLPHFDKIADFMHEAMTNENGKVFVHCYAGISRSTSSVIAYLIKYHGMDFHNARAFVRSKRSIICPNPGFVHQLNTFQKNCNVETKKPEKPLTSSVEGMSNMLRSSQQFGTPGNRTWGTALTNMANNTSTTKFGRTTFTVNGTNIVPTGPSNMSASVVIGSTSTITSARNMEEKKEPEPAVQLKFDYFCRTCGIKLFASDLIVHNTGRTFNAHCNAIYVNTLPWIASIPKSGYSKVSCPNTKCSNTLGFSNLKNGRCGCNKDIGNVWGIYPLRVTYAKVKA